MNKIGFFLSPALALLLLACYQLVTVFGGPDIAIGLLALSALYLLMPMADYWLGENTSNYRNASDQNRWMNLIPPGMVVAQTLHLGAFFWILQNTNPSSWALLLIAAGVISSITAINAAHELIHRPSHWQRQLGAVLLASVAYPGFKVEHVRGHHRWVATPRDPSSAPKGMSVYAFLPRAVWHNTISAWRLADAPHRSKNWPKRLLSNETLHGWALTVVLALGISVTFGFVAMWLWLGHAITAILTLEVINYIEHYGLRRKALANGQYEPVGPQHSWNCSRQLSNWLLLGLQRHSDHHAHAGRSYADLRHMPNAPQLPASYPTMMLLALCPPLWFRVMHARLPSPETKPGPPVRAAQ
jgi:alkane 1-monooxygenase